MHKLPSIPWRQHKQVVRTQPMPTFSLITYFYTRCLETFIDFIGFNEYVSSFISQSHSDATWRHKDHDHSQLCVMVVDGLAPAWPGHQQTSWWHYGDGIMGAIASQITSLTIVYSIVYSDADQRKHQSSASLAFVRRIHRGPVNSPHKWPVTRKIFPFDDVIMNSVVGNTNQMITSSGFSYRLQHDVVHDLHLTKYSTCQVWLKYLWVN